MLNCQWKRLIALMAAIVMVLSLFGCGNGNAPGNAETTAGEQAGAAAEESGTAASAEGAGKEPVTITWFGGAWANSLTKGIPEDPVNTELYKRTGVTVDHTPSLGVTDVPQKLAVMLAGGDLPDVITLGDGLLAPKVLTAKAAIPLDGLIESNGPDIKKNSGTALAMSKLLVSDSTNSLYFIPADVNGSDFKPSTMEHGWNIRWDLYKKLNYPKLETYEDFLNVLEEMIKLEPTNKDGKKNYGLGLFLAESWGTFMVDKPYADYQGIFVFGSYAAQIDMMTDKITSRLTDPNSAFWQAMKLWNTAYQRGLLDPESITLKYQTYSEKAKTGRYMAADCNWMLGGADAQFIQDGTPEKGYVPFLFANNKEKIYAGTINDGGSQYLTCITSNCKNPDRVIDLINYLNTPEGVALQRYGIQGTHYTVKDGRILWTDEVFDQYKNDPDFSKKTGINFSYNMNFLGPRGMKDASGADIDMESNPEFAAKSFTQVQKDFCEHYGYKTVTEDFTKVPTYLTPFSLASKLKTETGTELNAKEAQINSYVTSNDAKVIFTKSDAEFEKAKDKYISEVKKMGADQLVEFYSSQYETMKTKIAELTR